jgi:membrane-associated phospholipid phosphatase
VFFKYITHLGDGAMFGVLVLIFAFLKRRMIWVVLVSGVLTLLITYLFKKILFHGSYRPAMHMGADTLHWVEGVKVALWGTFPSGHTITIFAIATVLCLYFRKSQLQYTWIAIALLVAYSRVYLSLHFLNDVFVGSIFGILIGLVSMALFAKLPVESAQSSSN